MSERILISPTGFYHRLSFTSAKCLFSTYNVRRTSTECIVVHGIYISDCELKNGRWSGFRFSRTLPWPSTTEIIAVKIQIPTFNV